MLTRMNEQEENAGPTTPPRSKYLVAACWVQASTVPASSRLLNRNISMWSQCCGDAVIEEAHRRRFVSGVKEIVRGSDLHNCMGSIAAFNIRPHYQNVLLLTWEQARSLRDV